MYKITTLVVHMSLFIDDSQPAKLSLNDNALLLNSLMFNSLVMCHVFTTMTMTHDSGRLVSNFPLTVKLPWQVSNDRLPLFREFGQRN